MNPCVTSDSRVDWHRGRGELVLPVPGRFERIREPLIEVLVIIDVRLEDGTLFLLFLL